MYALRLVASGLTFFHDDVINVFSPHARDIRAIFPPSIGKLLETEIAVKAS